MFLNLAEILFILSALLPPPLSTLLFLTITAIEVEFSNNLVDELSEP